MMFDNAPIAQPSRWEMLKSHLPIMALVGGGIALFLSLHTAAYTVAAAGALHVVFGLTIMIVGSLRSRRAKRREATKLSTEAGPLDRSASQ